VIKQLVQHFEKIWDGTRICAQVKVVGDPM
jgi:hypothetical protein